MKHKPVATDSGWECQACKRTWKEQPGFLEELACPGVPVYGWGAWPDHLLTKKQMDEAGFQTGRNLPAPAGLVYRSKSPDGKMWLYDRNQGVPKRGMSDAQLAALAKVQAASKPVDIYCSRCGRHLFTTTAKQAVTITARLCDACTDHFKVVNAAAKLLEEPLLFLDLETTGLYDAEIVQIGIIDQDGKVLIDTLIKPTIPIPESAQNIHGISDEMVAGAPGFVDVYPRLAEVLTGQRVIIYNVEFDRGVLNHVCDIWALPHIDFRTNCAMHLYAKYVGDWSSYWGDYRWQPLPYGDHTAAGDCLGTLRLLKEMAADEEEKGESVNAD